MGTFGEGIRLLGRFIGHNPSVLYSLALLIIVPAILVGYGVWVTFSFQQLLDLNLQRQALLTHQTIETFIRDTHADDGALRRAVGQLQQSIQGELVDYTILQPTEDFISWQPVAGFTSELRLDAVFTQAQYALAWHENRSFATTVLRPGSDERLLLVTRPIHDSDNAQWGLATIALSLATHDALVSDVVVRTSLVLVMSVLVILLLIANHIRLFGYGVALEKQRELDQLKDDFISVTSHELRTPITGVRSFLSLLQEGQFGDLSAKGKQYIDEALTQADRLTALVSDMLDVSRIEQGRLQVQRERVIPAAVVAKVEQELAFRAEEKHLELTVAAKTQRAIMADPNHFRRIIINLIGNAIKYTKRGGVTVVVEEREGNVAIEVRDTGIGIPAEKLETLFKKFSRVHSDETAKVQGTGLGLWITKSLTEKMGGRIFVSSIYQQGSEFTVLFPVATDGARVKT